MVDYGIGNFFRDLDSPESDGEYVSMSFGFFVAREPLVEYCTGCISADGAYCKVLMFPWLAWADDQVCELFNTTYA